MVVRRVREYQPRTNPNHGFSHEAHVATVQNYRVDRVLRPRSLGLLQPNPGPTQYLCCSESASAWKVSCEQLLVFIQYPSLKSYAVSFNQTTIELRLFDICSRQIPVWKDSRDDKYVGGADHGCVILDSFVIESSCIKFTTATYCGSKIGRGYKYDSAKMP